MKNIVVKGSESTKELVDLSAQGIVCGAMGFKLGLNEKT